MREFSKDYTSYILVQVRETHSVHIYSGMGYGGALRRNLPDVASGGLFKSIGRGADVPAWSVMRASPSTSALSGR